MKKAMFHIEITGEMDVRDGEGGTEVKQRMEARFIPYLYNDKDFDVRQINSSTHIYTADSLIAVTPPVTEEELKA